MEGLGEVEGFRWRHCLVKESSDSLVGRVCVTTLCWPRRWMTLHNKEGSDSCGEVQVTIELLPKSLAALCPAGKGRGEPNAHPTLPEPEGRVKLSALTPFSVLKGLLGPACGTVCCAVSCVVLALILFVL